MPNTAISNPNFFDPQTPRFDTALPPFLGGMMYSKDRARYDEMSELADMLRREDVTAGAPVREAGRQDIIERLPIERRGLEADTRGKELNTEFAEAMQPGKIALGRGQQHTDQAIQIIAQTPPGPDYIARLEENLDRAGVDLDAAKGEWDPNGNPQRNELVKRIMNSGDPEEMQKLAQQFVQHQSFMDPKYRQAVDVANIQGAWGLKSAQASAAAANKPTDWTIARNNLIRAYRAQGMSELEATERATREVMNSQKLPSPIHSGATALAEKRAAAAAKIDEILPFITDPALKKRLEEQKAKLESGVGGSEGEQAPKQEQVQAPAGAMPIEEARQWLKKNNTPENRKFFEETYGVKP